MLRLSTPRKRLFMFVIPFAMVGSTLVYMSLASGEIELFEAESGTLSGNVTVVASEDAGSGALVQFGDPLPIDLKRHYPNADLIDTHYLDGFNHSLGNQLPSVLWFEQFQDADTVKMYNSSPASPTGRCHWDVLSWTGDMYTYAQTHHDCEGPSLDTIYHDPIVFLPRYWDGQPWTRNGSTPVSIVRDGTVVCRGTNNYVGEILGYVEVAPGEQTIHWRTTQTTTWTEGSDPTGCAAGRTTNWEENYFLTTKLPVMNLPGIDSALALKRTYGGNKDSHAVNNYWDWDVWFDTWAPLP